MNSERQPPPEELGQFEILFATSPVPAWVADLETFRALEVNEAALALYGYTRDQFLALDLHMVRAPELRESFADELAALTDERAVVHATHLTSSGSRLQVEVHSQEGHFRGRRVRFVQLIDRTGQVAAERRYQQLFDSANDALFSLDLQGRLTSVNHKACEVTGYTAEELVGRNAIELVVEEYRPGVLKALADIWSGVEVDEIVTQLQVKDGRRIWFEIRGRTIRNDGHIEGTFHIARDITERKESEEARAWLESVVNSSREAIVSRDLERKITSWNPAAAKLYGYTAEEALGQGEDFLDADPDHLFDPGGSPDGGVSEITRRRKDGALIQVHHSRFPVRDSTGQIIGFGAISYDLGPEREAQRALAEAQSWLRLFANAVPAVIWAIDAEGTFRMLEGQDLPRYGLAPGQLVGQSIFQYNADAPERIAAVRRVLAGESFTELGTFEDFTYEATYVPLRDAEGNVSGAVSIIFDVTERQLSQRSLRQAERLESLTVLAGGVAHDFNNLLVGIMGNASLAQMALPADSTAQQSLEEILEASNRAAELARQMLDFSGRSQMRRAPCRLDDAISEVLVRLGPQARDIRQQLDPSVPPVLCDPDQLRLMVNALVVNALEAAAETGGEVVLTTRAEHCSADRFQRAILSPSLPPGEYGVLEVADTGPGIDPEEVQRIFDPFYTTKFTGRGLGLAAALGLIRGHRGAVFVDSIPGSGSTFTVCLPLAT
ncbi:MAG: PAS domain S-box protein [Dehalococcoidia bacterium]